MSRLVQLFLYTTVVACTSSHVSWSAPSDGVAAADLALTGVNVVDVTDGAVHPDQTVLITKNRITAVGPSRSVAVPSGARVIDARGKYLIPGLIDMHVHLFNNVSRRPPNTWAFPLFVANGVTGVREMWTEFASVPLVRQWRRGVSEGELLAPRVLAVGALVDGPGAWMPNTPEITTPAEGRRFVREAVQAGTDFIKVYALLPRDVYEAILDEAREVGIPVAGHIPLRVPALEAARAGQRTNEHLYQIREACSTLEAQLIEERRRFYSTSYATAEENALLDEQVHRTGDAFDEQTCRAVARELAQAGQWQVPTLVNERRWFLGVPAERRHDPRLRYVPAPEREAWARRLDSGSVTYTGDSASLRRGWEVTLQTVAVLAAAGVPFMVGTDLGQPFILPGQAVHEEMALLVEAGLTPLQVLQAATINPSRLLEATDSLGTVEPGKLADLVLLDANPLEDITNTQQIRAVVLNGRYLDRQALDELLAQEASRP